MDGVVKDPKTQKQHFLPATKRSIYLTSHLNTNLDLESEHPDNKGLKFSQNWTSTIYQAKNDVSEATIDGMLLAPAYPSVLDQSVERGADLPYIFFKRDNIPYQYRGGAALLSSTPDGSGKTHVDDAVRVTVLRPDNGSEEVFEFDYSLAIPGQITPSDPMDISSVFTGGAGNYRITIEFMDRIPAYLGASDFYLVRER